MNSTLSTSLRANWFLLVAPLLVGVDVFFSLRYRETIGSFLEGGLLFDLAVLVPFSYWLCYRQKGKKAVLKALGLACLGVWIAAKLVPEANQILLNYIWPVRYVGLAVLTFIEIAVIVQLYKVVFKSGTEKDVASHIQSSLDLPPWAARLAAIEVMFWRKVRDAINRGVGRK